MASLVTVRTYHYSLRSRINHGVLQDALLAKSLRCVTSSCKSTPKKSKKADIWTSEKVNAYVGHTFPDFIEGWNRQVYRKVGYGRLQVIARTGAQFFRNTFYPNDLL